MRILWITNMPFPEVVNKIGVKTGVSGGWMFDLADGLSSKSDIELAIASIYSGNEFRKELVNNKIYYLIPGNGKTMLIYDKKLIPTWEHIYNDFHPDIVHLHGTEYRHGQVYLDRFPEQTYLLTIQGIMGPISREYYSNISLRELLRTLNWKDLKKGKCFLTDKYLAKSRHCSEEDVIRHVKYFTGRSDWDKALLTSINPEGKYFRCNYNLRSEFYIAPKYDVNKVDRYTIYGSTAFQLSFKGGGSLIKAISLVRKKYPNVKVKILIPGSKDGKFIISSGYSKLIKYWLDKYDVWDNFEFIPSQSAQGVIDTMLKCHCCVVPSTMENASSTLREAMHLGLPSIASYRGGMTHLIEDKVNGFFFDYPEYQVLAMRITELFDSDTLCQTISENAVKKAEIWHNRDANVTSMYEVYQYINNNKNN